MKKSFLVAVLFIISETSFCQSKTRSEDLKSVTKTETQASIPHKNFSALSLPVVYTFIGNGNWSDPANWDSNGVPPGETSPGSSIHIHSLIAGAKCILDVPYTVKAGTDPTTLVVYAGNNLVVPGSLTVK
jgi:hypothetical protein